MKVIINGDDFGYSPNINKAIEKALKQGLISSTSILANMPGFEEAVRMAKSQFFLNRVGIHLNLFEGKPITKEMQNCSLFCDKRGNYWGKIDENGIYRGKRKRIFDPLRINSGIIYNELSAQIDKVISKGIQPTHLDSHGQLHTNFFIGNIVIRLAKKYNIPSVRINSNLRKRRNIFSEMEIILYNIRLNRNGIKCANYVGTIPEITSKLHKLEGTIEVIVHPVCKNGILGDTEWKGELSHLLNQFQEKVKISYAEL